MNDCSGIVSKTLTGWWWGVSESESWPRENQQSISGHGVGHHFEPDDYSLEIEDGGGEGDN